MPLSFDVTRFEQNGRHIFAGIVSGLQLLEDNVRVDTWFSGSGYQRIRTENKIEKIAKFLNKTKGTMPTSILLSIRSKGVKFVPMRGNRGKLVIPPGAHVFVVDGQHRIWGLKKALETNPEIADFEFAAIFLCPAMWKADVPAEIEEGKYFITVNKTQTGVQGGLVDMFLLALSKAKAHYGLKALNGIPEEISEGLEGKVKALTISMLMNAKGPWEGLIQRPNERCANPL